MTTQPAAVAWMAAAIAGVLGGQVAARAADPPPAADLVLLGGVVLTMDPAQPVATAVAVREGRIALVGEDAAAAARIGPGTQVVRLDGACVVPGLIDAHGHLLSLGLAAEEIDLVGTRSYDEVVAKAAAAARERPKGAWVVGRGFDQNDWADQTLPTHDRLSAAVPDHPVCLTRVDGHAVLVNARALAAAGIDQATPDPAGGEVLRRPGGAPTGILTDNAIDLVWPLIPPPSREDRARAYERAARMCAEVGLTTVHDAGFDPRDVDLLVELAEAGRLPLRVYVMVSGDWGDQLARGPRTGLAGGLVTVRAVKMLADGALGSRGALLLEPYADRPEHVGAAVTAPDQLRDAARRARDAGFQVCVHAIGDAGNRAVLDIYEELLGGRGEELRWRVEHAQVLAPEDLPRFARLGVIASMQPTHCTSDMPWAEARVGPKRIAGAYAWRTLLRQGARLSFGSDFPVESHDPRKGIYAAVTRQDERGAPEGGWRPHERLSVEEAIRGFTADAAYASFQEGELGRIAPGLRADLLVLARDPRRVPPRELLSMPIVRRYLGGAAR